MKQHFTEHMTEITQGVYSGQPDILKTLLETPISSHQLVALLGSIIDHYKRSEAYLEPINEVWEQVKITNIPEKNSETALQAMIETAREQRLDLVEAFLRQKMTGKQQMPVKAREVISQTITTEPEGAKLEVTEDTTTSMTETIHSLISNKEEAALSALLLKNPLLPRDAVVLLNELKGKQSDADLFWKHVRINGKLGEEPDNYIVSMRSLAKALRLGNAAQFFREKEQHGMQIKRAVTVESMLPPLDWEASQLIEKTNANRVAPENDVVVASATQSINRVMEKFGGKAAYTEKPAIKEEEFNITVPQDLKSKTILEAMIRTIKRPGGDVYAKRGGQDIDLLPGETLIPAEQYWEIRIGLQFTQQNLIKAYNVLIPLLIRPEINPSFKVVKLPYIPKEGGSQAEVELLTEAALSYEDVKNCGYDRNPIAKSICIFVDRTKDWQDILLKIWKALEDHQIEWGQYDVPSGDKPLMVSGTHVRSPFTYAAFKNYQQRHGILFEDDANPFNYPDPLAEVTFTPELLKEYGISLEKAEQKAPIRKAYLSKHIRNATLLLQEELDALDKKIQQPDAPISQKIDQLLKKIQYGTQLAKKTFFFDKKATYQVCKEIKEELELLLKILPAEASKSVLDPFQDPGMAELKEVVDHFTVLTEATIFEQRHKIALNLGKAISNLEATKTFLMQEVRALKRDYQFKHPYFIRHPLQASLQKLLEGKNIEAMIEANPYGMQLYFRRLTILNYQSEQYQKEFEKKAYREHHLDYATTLLENTLKRVELKSQQPESSILCQIDQLLQLMEDGITLSKVYFWDEKAMFEIAQDIQKHLQLLISLLPVDEQSNKVISFDAFLENVTHFVSTKPTAKEIKEFFGSLEIIHKEELQQAKVILTKEITRLAESYYHYPLQPVMKRMLEQKDIAQMIAMSPYQMQLNFEAIKSINWQYKQYYNEFDTEIPAEETLLKSESNLNPMEVSSSKAEPMPVDRVEESVKPEKELDETEQQLAVIRQKITKAEAKIIEAERSTPKPANKQVQAQQNVALAEAEKRLKEAEKKLALAEAEKKLAEAKKKLAEARHKQHFILGEPHLNFLEAIRDGKSAFVKEWLKHPESDPALLDNVAIQMAARGGHLDIVTLLLADERVDPAANQNEALHAAQKNLHSKVVELLLQNEKVGALEANIFAQPEVLSSQRKLLESLSSDNAIFGFSLQRGTLNTRQVELLNQLVKDISKKLPGVKEYKIDDQKRHLELIFDLEESRNSFIEKEKGNLLFGLTYEGQNKYVGYGYPLKLSLNPLLPEEVKKIYAEKMEQLIMLAPMLMSAKEMQHSI